MTQINIILTKTNKWNKMLHRQIKTCLLHSLLPQHVDNPEPTYSSIQFNNSSVQFKNLFFVPTKDSIVEYNLLGCVYILCQYYFIKFLNINPTSAYNSYNSMRRSTWRPSRSSSRRFIKLANHTARKSSDVCIARHVIGQNWYASAATRLSWRENVKEGECEWRPLVFQSRNNWGRNTCGKLK